MIRRPFALLLLLVLTVGLAAGHRPLAAQDDAPDPDDCGTDDATDDAAAPVGSEVALDSGRIRGERLGEGDGAVHAFKGIPFAAPPVGNLRWRPPQPVAPWEGVKSCTEFGPACVQPGKPADVRGLTDVGGEQSEDCLYLNVWTAARTADEMRPVMVWIHGGGNTIGAASQRIYDGEQLAREGVVLVSINYRLGPFGWFAHPLLSEENARLADAAGTGETSETGESSETGETAPAAPRISGNYGLLDQIAALRWVQRNIAAFGGDPGCVTIFGESAGAVDVARLMASPTAKGLFHRAICQSGGATGNNRHLRERWYGLHSAEEIGEQVTAAVGCDDADDPLAALRTVPARELLEQFPPAVGLFGEGVKWGPIVDGVHIPDSPEVLWAEGRIHDVPFMAGSNANEGTMFIGRVPIRGPLGFRLMLRRLFPDDAQKLLELYPVDRGTDVKTVLDQLVTDSAFHVSARYMLRAHAKVESPAYRYYFTRVSPAMGPFGRTMGAAHGMEIPYVFTTLNRLWLRIPQDRQLADTMRGMWVHFARTGCPTDHRVDEDGESHGDLPAWPEWTADSDPYLEFGDEIRVGRGLRTAACDLFEARVNADRDARRTAPLRERRQR